MPNNLGAPLQAQQKPLAPLPNLPSKCCDIYVIIYIACATNPDILVIVGQTVQ